MPNSQPAHRLPPFERFPFRTPEPAVYRTDTPARGRGNPAYEALPAPCSEADVWKGVTADNPRFDPSVRDQPAHIRRECIDDVQRAIFPLARHVLLEDLLGTTIRNSYVGRNPAVENYMSDAVEECNRFSISTSGTGPVGSGAVFGPPGLGKSESIKRLLRWCYPQVIEHRVYGGQMLGIQQLAWLYVSCPPKASISALIEWLAAVLDRIFKTNAHEKVTAAKNDSLRARIIARHLALHVTGLVVVDELQNIHAGTNRERETFSNFLQELVNTTRTRFVFVGTPDAAAAIVGEAMGRRTVGERGTLNWAPLDPRTEWPTYIKHLWEWQVTRHPTPLTPALSDCMFQLTGGIPSHAVNLWTKAQAALIGNPNHPEEVISESLLEYTMATYFSDTHRKVRKERRRQQLVNQISGRRLGPDQYYALPAQGPDQHIKPPPPMGKAGNGFSLSEVLPNN